MNNPRLRRWLAIAALVLVCTTLPAVAFAQNAGLEQDTTEQDTADAEPGVLIVRVAAGSPADEVGLARGDIILTLDGDEVNSVAALLAALEDKEPGDEIELTVQHGDDTNELTVVLGENERGAYLGIAPFDDSADVSFSLRGRTAPAMPFAYAPEMQGVLVVEVVEDSPAATAGLEPGDLITAVNGDELDSDADLTEIVGGLAPGDEIELTVQRQDAKELEDDPEDTGEDNATEQVETETITVTLGEHPDDAEKAYLGIRWMPAFPGTRGMRMERMPFGGTIPFPEGMPFEGMPFEEMPRHLMPNCTVHCTMPRHHDRGQDAPEGRSRGEGPMFFFRGIPLDGMLPDVFHFFAPGTAPGEDSIQSEPATPEINILTPAPLLETTLL